MLITNIISSLEGKDSDFAKYEYSTYKKVFEDVKLFYVSTSNEEIRQNLIMVGFKGDKNIDEQKYEQYKDLLKREVVDYTSDKIVVTDNYCPIGS